MRYALFLAILLLTVLITGCVQTEKNSAMAVPAPAASTPPVPDSVLPSPVVTATATPVPVYHTEIALPVSPSQTAKPHVTATPGPVLPHITNLKYAPRGKYSECTMRMLIPDIVNDPEYGLNMSIESRLTAFSEGDYARLTREAKERSSAINPCYQTNLPPYWTWLEFSAILTQISGSPRTYNITLYATYENQKIPVIVSTETLNPRQDYPYKASIPIMSEQAEKIDQLELGFEPVLEDGNFT